MNSKFMEPHEMYGSFRSDFNMSWLVFGKSHSGHCLFFNDRMWSEDGDPRSRCPSVINVVCKLCVQCSVLSGSHKVGPQAAGHGGSHEQNVNTDQSINCELRPCDCVYSINSESELN